MNIEYVLSHDGYYLDKNLGNLGNSVAMFGSQRDFRDGEKDTVSPGCRGSS